MKPKHLSRPSSHRNTPPTVEHTTSSKVFDATTGQYDQYSRLDKSRQYLITANERLSSLRPNITACVEHTASIVDAAHAEMSSNIDESFTSIRDWLQRFMTAIEDCNDDKAAAITACKANVKMFPDVVDYPRKPSEKTVERLRECSRSLHWSIDHLKTFAQSGTNAMAVINDIIRLYDEMKVTATEMTEALSKSVATIDATLATIGAK